MITYGLFPTAVAKFELGREYTADEIAFVNSQETRKNHGNTTSKDSYILRHWVMADIKTFIESSVNEYLHSIYAPDTDVKLRITQSWLNYCKPNEWHHKHSHPNSFISGVLYIKATRERDKIYFYREDYQQIFISAKNFNMYNSDSWWLDAGAGDLIIFPSRLTHMVESVQEERISLSFNTFPFGDLGKELPLTALSLKGE